MTDQTELTCVSCDTTFDPSPNGGFCPDCDTPHPDYGVQDDTETEDAETEEADAEADADETEDAAEADESEDETTEESADEDAATPDGVLICPDCGAEISPEAAADAAEADAADADADTAEADADAAEADAADADAGAVPESVTLLIDGTGYTFDDGDTFGRQDDDWLQDLVSAAGGADEVAYVSGEHLEFSIEDDGAYVRDVSTNGTKRNGTSMDGGKEKLEDGDTLELAERVEIQVQL